MYIKALITGASSGIGYDMALVLDRLGYELILCSRNLEQLNQLGSLLKTPPKIIPLDLSVMENCYELYELTKNENIDFLINNAGYGAFGGFACVDLEKELNMIDLNVKCTHILTKLFLKDFIAKDSGKILNVASSAAFVPGPLFATYYSTKVYVYRLTQSIAAELKFSGSNVKVSVLCPGPVKTNFDKVAGIDFGAKALDSKYVAEYAISKALNGKTKIIPGFTMRMGVFFSRFISDSFASSFIYHFQKKKGK